MVGQVGTSGPTYTPMMWCLIEFLQDNISCGVECVRMCSKLAIIAGAFHRVSCSAANGRNFFGWLAIVTVVVVVVLAQSTKYGLHRKVYQVTRINN